MNCKIINLVKKNYDKLSTCYVLGCGFVGSIYTHIQVMKNTSDKSGLIPATIIGFGCGMGASVILPIYGTSILFANTYTHLSKKN